MSDFQAVAEPILNGPFAVPALHWHIEKGATPEKRAGRRASVYHVADATGEGTRAVELTLVNQLRERVTAWSAQGHPGVTGTTLELLQYWAREDRQRPLFFAQREAAETVIFLTEARADFLQGMTVPQDAGGDWERRACKMATGSGKTTVMGMLAAWQILNKSNDRRDKRFSDLVLVVCPNVTIRDRLRELDPQLGEASLYRTRDLVPSHLMPSLLQGRVLVANWHAFQPRTANAGGQTAKVLRTGVRKLVRETVRIGPKATTARGSRYVTREMYIAQVAAGELSVLEETVGADGQVEKAVVESERWVESDASLIRRVLQGSTKRSLLVLNDEAHHAYRVVADTEPEDVQGSLFEAEEDEAELIEEARVWIDGLDAVHRTRRINLAVDFSATPYFLTAAGKHAGEPFPWIVSDFGLVDAIEAGLVKVPQLALRDTTGEEKSVYFNLWRWIMSRLDSKERGGKRASPKPEAILKWAHSPLVQLANEWERDFLAWDGTSSDERPPVFIVVCKNTSLAKLVHEWLSDDRAAPEVPGIPRCQIEAFRNDASLPEGQVTIRVDSKVVHETDGGVEGSGSKADEARWMRYTLDTVGRAGWQRNSDGMQLVPAEFAELATKLGRPLHPPGRSVRCIVSVGMLTEGWDCNTVSHVVGLRPFMSQLLCEQVVGRGLRRRIYEVRDDGLLEEEVAWVLGVPFEIIPFKATTGPSTPPPKKHHVRALPSRSALEIRFPRVEGYTQAVRSRLTLDFGSVAKLSLDPTQIPTHVDMKAGLPDNQGRMTLSGPGDIHRIDVKEQLRGVRLQTVAFDLARALTRHYARQQSCEVPVHALFPQIAALVMRYLSEKVVPLAPATPEMVSFSPYYGMVIENMLERLGPDTAAGEAPEVPRYEARRRPGSTADVDFQTSKDVREVTRSHVNFVVADTKRWEQSAAYAIDTHPAVVAFVKNAGLGFTIPYLFAGFTHDYEPDFLICLASGQTLVLETKGFDPLAENKRVAAERWAAAVTAEGSYGTWTYRMARSVAEVTEVLDSLAS